MHPIFSAGATCAALVASLCVGPCYSGNVSLGGRVTENDSTGKAGVTVSLASMPSLTTTTAKDGSWALISPPSEVIARGARAVASSGNLVVMGGRLNVAFHGTDASGRTLAKAKRNQSSRHVAARAQASGPDTLVYSFGGRVFLRDTITNLDTTGIVRAFDTTWNTAISYGYLRDGRDSLVYRTVKIGTQTWMAENLRYWGFKSYYELNGRCYDDLIPNRATYGILYTWEEVMKRASSSTSSPSGVTGLCPAGWHVPSIAEWDKLTDSTLSSATAATVLKSTSGWRSGNGSDLYGFRVLPAGRHYHMGSFGELGSEGDFWTTDSSNRYSLHAHYKIFSYGVAYVMQSSDYKEANLSLRCLMD